MTATTETHAPCRCCGGDLCLSPVLDVWFHTDDDTVQLVAAGVVPPHLPDPAPEVTR